LTNVDVSATTAAFVRTVCLIIIVIIEFHTELVYRSTYEYIQKQGVGLNSVTVSRISWYQRDCISWQLMQWQITVYTRGEW